MLKGREAISQSDAPEFMNLPPKPPELGIWQVTVPKDKNTSYAVTIYAQKGQDGVFEVQSVAHLFSGEELRITSLEIHQVHYKGVPWWCAGTPDHPARPHDGSWPAVEVEATVGEEQKTGLLVISALSRMTYLGQPE